jgi:RNA polymerase sigma factor (sigma-70 family)
MDNELFEKYKNIVYKYAKKYGKYDYEEVLQEGFLALLKALKKLDNRTTSKPITFITEWVKWEMYAAIEKQGDVLYHENDVFDEEFYTTEDDFDTKLMLNDILKHTKLSNREHDVLDCMLQGLNPKQISEELGKNTQYVRNIKNRVMTKLKNTAKERGYINE